MFDVLLSQRLFLLVYSSSVYFLDNWKNIDQWQIHRATARQTDIRMENATFYGFVSCHFRQHSSSVASTNATLFTGFFYSLFLLIGSSMINDIFMDKISGGGHHTTNRHHFHTHFHRSFFLVLFSFSFLNRVNFHYKQRNRRHRASEKMWIL